VKGSVPLIIEAEEVGEIITETPELADVLLGVDESEPPAAPAHPDAQDMIARMARRNRDIATRFGDEEFISIECSLFLKLFISSAMQQRCELPGGAGSKG
jgi:hypothetical protein